MPAISVLNEKAMNISLLVFARFEDVLNFIWILLVRSSFTIQGRLLKNAECLKEIANDWA